MSKTVVEILREARALVARPGGWRQEKFGNSEKCCAAGAINLVERGQAGASASSPANALLLNVVGSADWFCVAQWNDAPGRTQAEVVAAFDKAIALAEGRPPQEKDRG